MGWTATGCITCFQVLEQTEAFTERDGTKVFIGLAELSCITAMVVETQFYIFAETSGTIYQRVNFTVCK